MTIAPQLPALPSWITVRSILPRASRQFTAFDFSLFLDLVRYSINTLLYSIGTIVLFQTMKFVASYKCGGAEAAGHMGLSITLVQTLTILFMPAVGVLHARVGQMHGEGRDAEIPALLAKVLETTGLLLVPTVVFLVLDADAIFAAWLGDSLPPEVLAQLASTSQSMFVGQGLLILGLPCYNAMLGIGKHRILGIAMVALAVVNSVVGAAVATAIPRIETIGMVFGVLVSTLALFVNFPAALRHFPIPVGRLVTHALGIPLVVSIPGAVAMSLAPDLAHPLARLTLDAALFGIFALPGLEFARRRLLR
jgi:O-antigen/teichoic acid export membrane protein